MIPKLDPDRPAPRSEALESCAAVEGKVERAISIVGNGARGIHIAAVSNHEGLQLSMRHEVQLHPERGECFAHRPSAARARDRLGSGVVDAILRVVVTDRERTALIERGGNCSRKGLLCRLGLVVYEPRER